MALASPNEANSSHDGPRGIADDNGVNYWNQFANQHWLQTSKSKKIKPDIIKKELWDVLEKDGFQFRSLLVLENLQVLEACVHPKTALVSLGADIEQLSMACFQRGFFEPSCLLDCNICTCQA